MLSGHSVHVYWKDNGFHENNQGETFSSLSNSFQRQVFAIKSAGQLLRATWATPLMVVHPVFAGGISTGAQRELQRKEGIFATNCQSGQDIPRNCSHQWIPCNKTMFRAQRPGLSHSRSHSQSFEVWKVKVKYPKLCYLKHVQTITHPCSAQNLLLTHAQELPFCDTSGLQLLAGEAREHLAPC